MNSPESFYEPMDNPSDKLQRQMWKAIQREFRHVEKKEAFLLDRRSFVYGSIASLMFIFACVGIYSTLSKLIDSSKPQSIRIDSAYESAIHQFEGFIPVSSTAPPEQKNILSTRKEQLQYLDGAIGEMKKEINGNDVSPLKRARLRQLYSMKLGVLQEMIERGEIDL